MIKHKINNNKQAVQKADFHFLNLEKIHQEWNNKSLPANLKRTAEIALNGNDLSGDKLEKEISNEYIIGAFDYFVDAEKHIIDTLLTILRS